MLDVIIYLEIIFWIFVVLALIYLIFKKVADRKKETFEKRDN